MPIQLAHLDHDDMMECPLCMEPLEVDDINFFPCQCGYQICRFCWHRIRTDENGLCPACRKPYPENPAEFKPLSDQELQSIKQVKKQKEAERKQKITDNRRHLASVRVLQKNLVFVVGLSQRLADPEILKKPGYFGKYGKILKVVINSNTSYAGTQTPSSTAYVTYSKMEEALRAIQSVNNVYIDGRTLKASLGTTKYCSNYLKNQACTKTDCMYLHESGDQEASFTKDDMQASKHQEYEQRLIQEMVNREKEQLEMQKNRTSPEVNDEEMINGEHEPKERSRRHSGSVDKPSSPVCHLAVRSNSVKSSGKYSSSVGDKPNIETLRRKNKKMKNNEKLNERKKVDDKGDVSTTTEISEKEKQFKNEFIDKRVKDKAEEDLEERLSTKPIDIPLSPEQNQKTPPPVQYNSLMSETSSSTGQEFSSVEGSLIQSNSRPPSHLKEHEIPPPATLEQQSSIGQQSRLHTYKDIEFGHSLFSNHFGDNKSELTDFAQPYSNQDINQNTLNLPTSFSPNTLPPGMTDIPSQPHDNWNTQNHKLLDKIEIKSNNDWETAFGFPPATKEMTPDDDLGFDPIADATRGLADLLAEGEHSYGHGHNHGGLLPSNQPTSFGSAISRPETLPSQFRNPAQFPPPFSNFGQTSFNPPKESPTQPLGGDMGHLPSWNNYSPHKPPLHSMFMQRQKDPNIGNKFIPPSSVQQNLFPSQNPGVTNDQEWQNGLRALLPNININFATNPSLKHSQTEPSFMSRKHNVPPPPGVGGFPSRRSQPSFPRHKQWNPQQQQTSPISPAPGFNSLLSPTQNNMRFPGGFEPPKPSMSHNIFLQDPAIITGGNTHNTYIEGPQHFHNSAVNGSKFLTSFSGNSNGANEDIPHWMNSLQSLTIDNESPVNSSSTISNMFPQSSNQNTSSSYGWPTTNNVLAPPMNTSQPPPGFQMRQTLGGRPLNKFGLSHNLLENQS